MNGNNGKDEGDFCRILLKTNALRFGVFKLTSGKLSPYYIDLRALPSYPESFNIHLSLLFVGDMLFNRRKEVAGKN